LLFLTDIVEFVFSYTRGKRVSFHKAIFIFSNTGKNVNLVAMHFSAARCSREPSISARCSEMHTRLLTYNRFRCLISAAPGDMTPHQLSSRKPVQKYYSAWQPPCCVQLRHVFKPSNDPIKILPSHRFQRTRQNSLQLD
jgi:hypothetical protein